MTGSHEVVGSSPISSTPPSGVDVVVGAHAFRERFGYWMQLAATGTDVVVTRHSTTRVRLTQAAPPADNAT